MREAVIVACLAVLGGCASTPASREPDAVPRSGDFEAFGDMPRWSLRIGPTNLFYLDETNRVRVVEQHRGTRVPSEGRWATRRILLETRSESCALPGRGTFAQRVRVTVDGKSFEGCGGGLINDLGLSGGKWSIVSVNGRSTPADRPYLANFDGRNGTLQLGCVTLTFPYRLAGPVLSAGAVRRIEDRCVDAQPATDGERALSAPLEVEAVGAEQLTLRNERGSIALIRG